MALMWAAGSAAALTWAAALALAISAVMAGLSAAAGVLRPGVGYGSIPMVGPTATPDYNPLQLHCVLTSVSISGHDCAT